MHAAAADFASAEKAFRYAQAERSAHDSKIAAEKVLKKSPRCVRGDLEQLQQLQQRLRNASCSEWEHLAARSIVLAVVQRHARAGDGLSVAGQSQSSAFREPLGRHRG